MPGPVATSEPMLLGEVRRNLTMYASGAPPPGQGLYVAESMGGWASRLRAGSGLPVALRSAQRQRAGRAETLRGRLPGADGLLAAEGADTVPISFVAPRQPRVAKEPKQAQLLFGAAAVLLLLLSGGIYGYLALSAADDDFGRLQMRKTDLEDSVKTMEPDAKRLDAARKWQGRRVNWLDEMFEMTTRLPASDKFFVSSFEGKAAPTDQKGNQPNGQGMITFKVASRNLETVAGVAEALHREPKYYTGISTTTGGFSREDSQAKEYTVFTRVIGRTPDQFTTLPSFKPPARLNYPPKGGAAPKPKPEPDEDTPPPRDKKDAGAGDGDGQ